MLLLASYTGAVDFSVWKVPLNNEWGSFSFHKGIRSINLYDILLGGEKARENSVFRYQQLGNQGLTQFSPNVATHIKVVRMFQIT